MSDIINIIEKPIFDERITKKEYHVYTPFTSSFKNSDEIRISVQHQDLYLLPCESYIYVEGALVDDKGAKLAAADAKLSNNCMAFLFDEIRYELNGIEIDQTRNVGLTSTLKNYISLNEDQSKMLYNSGWSTDGEITVSDAFFSFCVPLSILLGFTEDYKKIILNARHDLILVRARSDNNVVKTSKPFTLQIHKVQWRIPHVNVSDAERISLLNVVNSGKPLLMSFRSWDLYEYPVLPSQSSHHVWRVKTSTQLEKPRFVVFALQTGKSNISNENATTFDHCNLTDVKVFLNSDVYPYDDLSLKFERDLYAILYNMYIKFQTSYYGKEATPLLKWSTFKTQAPVTVIDCSHQNEAIKTGPVDVKIEFKTSVNFPANTSAYCLLLHDRIIEYNPLTSIVKRVI